MDQAPGSTSSTIDGGGSGGVYGGAIDKSRDAAEGADTYHDELEAREAELGG